MLKKIASIGTNDHGQIPVLGERQGGKHEGNFGQMCGMHTGSQETEETSDEAVGFGVCQETHCT